MKIVRVFSTVMTALSVAVASGAGFGLYEMDAKSSAMGGNVVGTPFNASAVYYNPAGLSCITGTCVNVNCVVLHPPIPYRTWGKNCENGGGRCEPGAFVFPTAFVSQELPLDLTAGLGFYADFGLGSEYDRSWALKYDSVESLFEGFTVNPALSWKIPEVEGLSIGGGLRVTYVNFETESIHDFSAFGAGSNSLRLDADNSRGLGLGFNLGARYELTREISLGVMYRSPLHTKVQGDATWSGGAFPLKDHSNDCESALTLPQQVTVGFNWRDFLVKDLHFGMSASYIGWSSMDRFTFDVYNPLYRTETRQEMNLSWRDTMRVGLGFEYEITENYEALLGYVFDKDPCSTSRGLSHTMLPAGDRHVICFGLAAHTADRRWEFAATYCPIVMQHSCSAYADEWTDRTRYMDTTASCTHCIVLGATYNF